MPEKIKSPAQEKHEYYRDIMKESTTLADLSAIRTEYTTDSVLTDDSQGALKSLYEMNETRIKISFTAEPGRAAPAYAQPTPQERVAQSHAQDDANAFVTPAIAEQVFPEVEIITTNTTPNETLPTPTPEPTQHDDVKDVVHPIGNSVPNVEPTAGTVGTDESKQEDAPKKRTRTPSKDGKVGTGTVGREGVSSVTLGRIIQLPLDGNQYTKNGFNIELTASSYEEAKTAIEEAFADFTESTKLISKDHVDKAYAQGLEDGKKSVPPAPVAKPIPSAKKESYTTNPERMKKMILQICEAFPDVKLFAQNFAQLNPIVEESSIV